MNIHLKEKNEINRIYDLLQNKAKNYQAFKRNEIPEKWHYRNSPRIGDLIIVAEPGWSLITNRNLKNIRKYGMAGNHGWDNYDPQMHGIFYGVGPDFKKGYKTGTLRNIDIYPLIANILDISEPAKVDGQLDSIKHIIINNN